MRPTIRATTILSVAVASAILAGGCAPAGAELRDGTGWTVTRLDLEVRLGNEEPSMTIQGTLEARLDAGRSSGPSFSLNAQGSGVRWLSLAGPGGGQVELNEQSGSATLAHLRYAEAFAEGVDVGTVDINPILIGFNLGYRL